MNINLFVYTNLVEHIYYVFCSSSRVHGNIILERCPSIVVHCFETRYG